MQMPLQKGLLLGFKYENSNATPSLQFRSIVDHHSCQPRPTMCHFGCSPFANALLSLSARSSWFNPCNEATTIAPQISHFSPTTAPSTPPSCQPQSNDSKIQDSASKQQ
mmetsp:Transcript_20095/g.30795  ORF Transcript_20095/g.30795 Transcript_20095/m.30795 type:complete len:109 (+) Transcript_20095:272-598(+)